MSKPNQLIADRYRLVELLGRGGMATVWRADHLLMRSQVALKLIHDSVAMEPDGIARFLREAQAAAALRSPNVVQIFDVGVHDGVPYIAMELLEGETLAARLERTTRLSAADTLRIVTAIGRAIGRAHELGIVHRDVKPENVFLARYEDEEIPKVLDFGIAKLFGSFASSDAHATATGRLVGTPYYMSPEQALGKKDIDPRTDLYALALIAFMCLCGREPFDAASIPELLVKITTEPLPVPSTVADVPAGFDAWFARAAARDRAKRFETARQMMEALRSAIADDAASMPGSVATEASRGSAPRAELVTVPAESAASSGRAVRDRALIDTTRAATASDLASSARSPWSRSFATVLLLAVVVVGFASFGWSRIRPVAQNGAADGSTTAAVREPEPPASATTVASADVAPTPAPAVGAADSAAGVASLAPRPALATVATSSRPRPSTNAGIERPAPPTVPAPAESKPAQPSVAPPTTAKPTIRGPVAKDL